MTSVRDNTEDATYAALKVIEALYMEGLIKPHIYRNILDEYARIIDVSQFRVAKV